MKTKSDKMLLFAMLLSMCIWGVAWSSAKVLSSYGNPSTLAFIRFFIVPLVLYPMLLVSKTKIKVEKSGIPYVLSAGLFMVLYTLCFFKGLKVGLAGAGGVLVTTLNPIIAYILGLLISRVLPKKQEVLGLIIGIIAGATLLNVWSGMEGMMTPGNVFFLMGAFLWAFISKVSSYATRFGSAIGFSFWTHIITVIGLAFVVDFADVVKVLTTGDQLFWGNILFFGIINSALATTCYFYATARIGPEKSSSFIFLVPAGAALGAWVFIGEAIAWYTVIGGILGIIAVLLINGKFSLKEKFSVN